MGKLHGSAHNSVARRNCGPYDEKTASSEGKESNSHLQGSKKPGLF